MHNKHIEINNNLMSMMESLLTLEFIEKSIRNKRTGQKWLRLLQDIIMQFIKLSKNVTNRAESYTIRNKISGFSQHKK